MGARLESLTKYTGVWLKQNKIYPFQKGRESWKVSLFSLKIPKLCARTSSEVVRSSHPFRRTSKIRFFPNSRILGLGSKTPQYAHSSPYLICAYCVPSTALRSPVGKWQWESIAWVLAEGIHLWRAHTSDSIKGANAVCWTIWAGDRRNANIPWRHLSKHNI